MFLSTSILLKPENLKAFGFISVMLAGIFKHPKPVCAKAFLPIVVTVKPLIFTGIVAFVSSPIYLEMQIVLSSSTLY